MFRLWVKEIKGNRIRKNTTVCDASEDTRTHKVFRALDQACQEFELGRPIWLDVNVKDFQRFSKTRFYQDSFVEQIDFDFLEIHIIEED